MNLTTSLPKVTIKYTAQHQSTPQIERFCENNWLQLRQQGSACLQNGLQLQDFEGLEDYHQSALINLLPPLKPEPRTSSIDASPTEGRAVGLRSNFLDICWCTSLPKSSVFIYCKY